MLVAFSIKKFQIFDGEKWLPLTLLIFFLSPAIIIILVLKCFNLYRVTDCPYCGFHEAQKLGDSSGKA